MIKSFSPDGKHIRRSFKRCNRPSNSSNRQPPESGWCPNPTTSGHCRWISATFAKIRSAHIPVTRMVGFWPFGWPDSSLSSGILARTVGFQPISQNPAQMARFRPLSPESVQLRFRPLS
jgi:hypothetical protein